MTRFYLSLFSLIVLCSSCRKDVPSHVVTQVDGIVRDPATNEPLAGVPVRISGMHRTFYGPSWHFLPDGDTSDANGEFSIRFNSDGESKSFRAEVLVDNIDKFYGTTSAELNTRRYNKITLYTNRTKVLEVHLKVLENPFDTMWAGSSFTGPVYLYGRSKDTVIQLRYNPSLPFTIAGFSVRDRSVGRQRTLLDTTVLPQPVPDVLPVEVIIDNTKDLPLH